MLDTDGEHFDCETCEVADALASLDADNADAWRVYGQCLSRFAVDLGLVPVQFKALVSGRSDADVVDLMERLAVIYDVLSPPPPPRQE